ncbi:MAG TPA: glycosyl hydrolase, partial [Caldithrix abyssi]|nr:glycosyl hydrolase [Caldithrix abyssi]
SDGGNTWHHVLYVNPNTGAVDLVIDPQDPNVLYAATWERTRRAWNFWEGGTGSGIYKSTDGGENWKLISTEQSGFPHGDFVGRIGLTISPQTPQILYAVVDNQKHRKKEKEELIVTKDLLRKISVKDFLKIKPEDLNAFLDHYNFPLEFNADTLFQLVKKGKIKPVTLVEYLEDANVELFDAPVTGAEVYRSEDGGQTWKRTHQGLLDKVFYSFGYYFGNIRIAPKDFNKIYLLGVPVLVSTDGGQTFQSINQENVHVDHHALWINPNNPNHLILGNDGGINISYDNGRTWLKANHPPVGQFYTVAVDMAKPYHVYGGLQDNGVWMGPSNHRESRSWQQSGHYAFKSIMGGDGMQVAIDTRTNQIVYTGFQFGNYFRIDLTNNKSKRITPKHQLGERPLRFNWQTPIHLSQYNQDILYIGAQKVFRSMDRGEHWTAISSDLTKGGKNGDVPYGTLTSIHESPLKFGLIYAGSDDGLVHVTKDGVAHWERISDSLPQDFWV